MTATFVSDDGQWKIREERTATSHYWRLLRATGNGRLFSQVDTYATYAEARAGLDRRSSTA